MPLLLYVGRLSPEKGVDDLLRATAQLHEQNPDAVRLLIVGDGAQREPLWHLAVELGLERVVGWVGRVAPDEVNTYLTAADLICLPSHMEGVPNVALEAFACGRPVVASQVGGIPEIMTDDTGVMTEPRNPRSLATAIQFALQAKWDETTIRQHAKGFDWSQNARELETILTHAIDTRPCQQQAGGQN